MAPMGNQLSDSSWQVTTAFPLLFHSIRVGSRLSLCGVSSTFNSSLQFRAFFFEHIRRLPEEKVFGRESIRREFTSLESFHWIRLIRIYTNVCELSWFFIIKKLFIYNERKKKQYQFSEILSIFVYLNFITLFNKSS